MAIEQRKQVTQMRRAGYGQKGAVIDLVCNYFRTRYQHTEDIYQYNVSIEPEVRNKGASRQVVAKLYEVFGVTELKGKNYAFDGEKVLYVVGSLPFNSQEFRVFLDEDRRHTSGGAPSGSEEGARKKRRVDSNRGEFRVKVEFTSRVNMNAIVALNSRRNHPDSEDALRVLDVVLREHASRRGFILIRESFFHSSLGRTGNLGEGVESWTGYDVSFRPTESGVLLNLDLSTTTMIRALPVVDFLKEHFRKDPMQFNQAEWAKAKRLLKGIRIQTTHTGMNHKISGFSSETAESLRFTKKIKDQNGSVVNVEEVKIVDYYLTTYNLRLKHRVLPCLDVGKANRPVYLPLEFCRILPGQRYTKSLTSSQRTKLILESRQPPNVRRDLVLKAMDVNNYQVDQLIKDFNTLIDRNLVSIKGRVLDAPLIRFKELQEVPKFGRWNLNNKVMDVGANISTWVVANFSYLHPQAVQQLVQSVQRCCNRKGMNMNEPIQVFNEDRNMQDQDPGRRVGRIFDDMRSSLPSKPNMIFCILPTKGCNLYAPFKKACEGQFGVISQCIVPPANANDQFFTNVAMKINVKCGGLNSVLKSWFPRISSIATMIFGLDVSHGVTGDFQNASLAAVVASTDIHYARYAARVRVQQGRNEIISGLYDEVQNNGMVRQLLLHFYEANKKVKPQQIIIFRDGVSESQFENVLREELSSFKKAFHQMEEDYNPKVTIYVVQKRHHTRFFPINGFENVPAGTVVDRELVRPRDYDFFLCSHYGSNKGTSRPSHYTVLHDENNFTADELQHLAYYLCYVYSRCTTAISVVAPVYYAHLAAKHCFNILEGDTGSETQSQASDTSTQVERVAAALQLKLDLHTAVQDRMYFC